MKSCNALDFERSMHRLQDFWSHRNKGFTGGHAVGGLAYKKVGTNPGGYGRVDGYFLSPDLDNVAWDLAQEATKTWLEKWNKKCCCYKNKEVIDTRTHNNYTRKVK